MKPTNSIVVFHLVLIMLGSLVSVNVFADAPPSPAPSSPSSGSIVEAVKAACQKRVDIGLIQGAVIGSIVGPDEADVNNQSEIFCGDASSEHEGFELGSISKSFAGIALAKFSIEGRINIDHAISEYLPELAGSDMGNVTPRQLATHTAGLIRDYPGPGKSWLYNEQDLVAFLKGYTPNQFPPGSRNYSNVGFGTLGLVLSRVAHQSFQQLIQTEVIDVLSMGETGFDTSSVKPANLVQGYDVLLEPAQFRTVSDLAGAAGGITSDLHDMMIYLRANLHPDSSLLGRSMKFSHEQGLGWDSLPGELPTWKNGAMTDGFSTVIEFDPTKNLGTVVLGNEFSGPSMTTIGYVAMGGKDTSQQKEVSSDFQNSVSGKYTSEDGTLEIDVFPTHLHFLGVHFPYIGGIMPARLLSLPGSSIEFSLDNGSVSGDRVLFANDPTSHQRMIIYFDYKNDDSAGNPVYEIKTFRANS